MPHLLLDHLLVLKVLDCNQILSEDSLGMCPETLDRVQVAADGRIEN